MAGYFGAFHGALTGADNAKFVARIYGLDAKQMLAEVEAFAELGQYFRMPLNTYSSGMKGRLAMAVSLAVNFDCYLIDEITGAGDHRFQERCEAALTARRDNGTLLMISHSPDILRAYCTSGLLLDRGKLIAYDTVDEMIEAYHAL